MTSNGPDKEAFVWIWLPGETAPVVAGRLIAAGDQLLFHYGRSYLARNNAIALYEPERPLPAGLIPPLPGLSMPGCIRDGSPDAWGRRVIINRKLGFSAVPTGGNRDPRRSAGQDCDQAGPAPTDRALLWGRQFLNPYAFEGLGDDAAYLKARADDARARGARVS